MSKYLLRLTLALALAASVAPIGCEQAASQPASQPGPQPQSLPTIKLTLGSREFTLEVAPDEQTRNMGLMYRDSMPADHGMIFSFPNEQPLSFWMKNTRIPLDIIYLDKGGRIVSILPMRPLDLAGVESGKPAMYAIELNRGIAATTGLRIGDVVKVPAEVTAAAR